MSEDEAIFKQANGIYLANSLLFSGQQRQDLARLHGFIRAAHEYVNDTPQRLGKLDDLIAVWQKLGDAPMRDLEASDQDDRNTRIGKNMARLKIIYGFNVAWVDAFLVSMLMDAKPKTYKTLPESLQYVYGSAESVGLMVAGLLRLPKEAHEPAKLQARALQWMAFVRDIAPHAQAGRNYFPAEDLARFGLADLQPETARRHPEKFAAFVRFQIDRAQSWQQEASRGLPYVPRRARVAVHAAIDGHGYTAKQIAKDPLIVYQKKVIPGRLRLILSAIGHSFD